MTVLVDSYVKGKGSTSNNCKVHNARVEKTTVRCLCGVQGSWDNNFLMSKALDLMKNIWAVPKTFSCKRC